MNRILRQQRPSRTVTRRSLTASVATSLALLAAAVLFLVSIGSDTAYATSFNPTATAALADSTTGANSNIVTTFDVPAPNSNFGAIINFIPPQFFVAADADVDNGASGAVLTAQATLGLLNGPCAPSGIAPTFDMMDATTDTSGPTVSFNDDPADPGTTGEIFEDGDGNGFPDGVDKYPDFLLGTFAGLTPHARLFGWTSVVGVDVSLNFVIFKPGATFTNPTTGNTFQTDPALGYPSFSVLQNAGDPAAEPEPGPITDFCTPLASETTSFGMAGADEFRRNPDTAGTYNFILFAASIPDADDDGFENNFDTCPFDANLDGDPRGPADPEGAGEGIDSACDPDPTDFCEGDPGDFAFVSDCDADQFFNRQDNCPWVNNGAQFDNQRDTDGDTIGDACDIAGAVITFPDGSTGSALGPNTIDGHIHIVSRVSPVTVGAGGAPSWTEDCLIAEEVRVGIDCDGDGVFDSLDNCPPPENASASELEAAANPGQEDADGDGIGDACDTTTTTTVAGDGDETVAGEVTGPGGAAGGTGGAAGGTGGAAGGAATGVGSLAPIASSIPAWAAIASGLGLTGILGTLGAIASRIIRRRR